MKTKFLIPFGMTMLISQLAFAQAEFGGRTITFADLNSIMVQFAAKQLVPGTQAPVTKVFSLNQNRTIPLSDLWVEKPLAIFFSSQTCDYGCRYLSDLVELHKKYQGEVEFAFIYIREAHAADGWSKPSVKVQSDQHTMEDRIEVAKKFARYAKLPFPIYVDSMDDATAKAFAAWPLRHHLIAKGGKLAFAGGLGPWGYRPLRKTPQTEADLGDKLSFVPPREKRICMEAILDWHLDRDLVAASPFSGKTIKTSKQAREIIYHRLENIPPRSFTGKNPPLYSLNGDVTNLKEITKGHPTVITFGSLSESTIRNSAQDMKRLYQKFGDQFKFIHIYIREADVRRLSQLTRIFTPDFSNSTLNGRLAAAKRAQQMLQIDYPVYVDSIDDAAAIYYSAWPSRIVVLDSQGRIDYRGHQGPWLFKPTTDFVLPDPDFNEELLTRPEDIESVEQFLERQVKQL